MPGSPGHETRALRFSAGMRSQLGLLVDPVFADPAMLASALKRYTCPGLE